MINELFAVSASSPPNCEDSPRNFVPINQFPEERRASRVALFHYRIALAKIRVRCSYFGIPQTACQACGSFLWRRISSRSPVNMYRVLRCACQKSWHAYTWENLKFSRNFAQGWRKITSFPISIYFFLQLRSLL